MENVKTYQKYVIIGTARTGTTMLWSYLNSHPEILCLRGVFGATKKINFGKYYDSLEDECFNADLINQRNTKPTEFIEKYVFKMYHKNYKAVGLKYFYDHDRHLKNKNNLIDYFVEDKDIKFLHIKRTNLLRTLYSYKRALNNKNWHKQEKNEFKTKLSIKECETYFAEIIKQQQRFDNLFKDRIFQINYEELITKTPKILADIQIFLGVSNLFEYKVQPKIFGNKSLLKQVILNFEELKKHFTNTIYSQYFNEQDEY